MDSFNLHELAKSLLDKALKRQPLSSDEWSLMYNELTGKHSQASGCRVCFVNEYDEVKEIVEKKSQEETVIVEEIEVPVATTKPAPKKSKKK